MSQTISENQSKISTRKAFGKALVRLGQEFPELVVLDPEIGNSTASDEFKKAFPERFIEVYLTEQNVVSMATGLSKMGKIPVCSSYGAFWTRAHDQIRMNQYSQGRILINGSHGGVTVGEDGSSQMGLEDISLFRCMLDSVVLYPSDAVSCDKLTELAVKYLRDNPSTVYLRTTRPETNILYEVKQDFILGGSKTLRSSDTDAATIMAAGITVHEALKAYEELQKEGINIRVVDMYSIKPLDKDVIWKACMETKALVVVEDHFQEGGLYEAICSSGKCVQRCYSLCVQKMPRSGKPEELMEYEGIDCAAICNQVRATLQ